MADKQIEQSGSKFSQVLDVAAQLPGVRINRSEYLRTALQRHCTDAQIELAIAESPAAAQIPHEVIKAAANTSISFETSKVTTISAAAGLPGGMGDHRDRPRGHGAIHRPYDSHCAEARPHL